MKRLVGWVLIALGTDFAAGQAGLSTAPEAGGTPLVKVAEDLQKKLDVTTQELAKFREEVEAEKVPLTKQLSALEEKIIAARKEYDQVIRLRDSRTLDVTNLKSQIKSKEDTTNYVQNLIDEFVRNSESRFHQSEVERYGKEIETRRNAALNANLPLERKLGARLEQLDLLVGRLEAGLGGEVFDGAAVNSKSGVVSQGKFLLLGPMGYFSTQDGKERGMADSQLNSASTVVLPLPPEVQSDGITQTLYQGEGVMPVDPTRGSAFKVEETQLSIADQFRKGGPVMYPIGALGAVAVLIGVLKWVQLSLVRRPSNKRVKKLLAALDSGNEQEAMAIIKKVGGPVARMLSAAKKHYQDPPTMMEESMFETVLDARVTLNSWIPFIKISAAVEPLLGLLGTVTGMINTFNLITIFGTGDASTFSSGISEALLTTMWGLVTAIPCLLMAAFLSRKARAALDDMEKLAVRMMNHRNHQDAVRERGGSDGDRTGTAIETPATARSVVDEPRGLAEGDALGSPA